jgi:hypothetical protein
MAVWSARQQKDGGIRGTAGAQNRNRRYSFLDKMAT